MLRPSLNLNGEMAELVEGAPLLREYGVKNSIEGSNPSLSAIQSETLVPFLRVSRKGVIFKAFHAISACVREQSPLEAHPMGCNFPIFLQ